MASGSSSPWFDAQTMRLARQESEAQRIVGRAAAQLPTFNWSTPRASAEQNKALSQHAMEGYRISREISDC